jgi:uncharacterized membrane protein YhaH (DUF805 family)
MAGSAYRGRFSRRQLVVNLFLSALFAAGITVVWGLWISEDGRIPEGAGLAGVIITFIFHTIVVVRRLHDLDRSGWQIWLFLVPIYNIYLGALLLFKKGTEGNNRFGFDPLA